VLAVVLTGLCGLWIRQAEIVVLSTQISESIPAVPGLASLVLLLPVNAVLRRLPWVRPLSRGELLAIFLFVTIAASMMGPGILRYLLASITAPFYFPSSGISAIRAHFPAWVVPGDVEMIRRLYESAPDGRVPWEAWAPTGLIWGGFFVSLWICLYSMMALFYRAWAEDERLTFPLAFLPMEMTGSGGRSGFFRNPLMWAGFALSALYNGVNILYALNPSFPSFGKLVDLAPAFPDAPWSAMKPLEFHFRPEMIGLGYLVSTEVSLTVWLSFLVEKLAAVYGVATGYPTGQLPYLQEQGIGAYLVLAGVVIWLSRRHLMTAWRLAINGQRQAGPEGITYRAAFTGLLAGGAAVWWFLSATGMASWVALAYLAVVLAVALVYGRLRGEAGVPLVWLFPYYQQKGVFLYTFGSHPFLASGQGTLPAWGLYAVLARGYFPAMTGYQVEAMEIARRAGLSPRRIAFALLLAVAVGWGVGWYDHLTPYYHHGAQQLRGGIWGTALAVPEYQNAVKFEVSPRLPDEPRIWSTGVGGVVALGLTLLRLRFAAFPLHPLGYAMTCSYGSLIWGSFFVVWLLKSLALRYGGMAFYRRTIPFFLGFALGHFGIAGILWGLAGAWTGEAVRGYQVWFG
jgi:hypothetical protein